MGGDPYSAIASGLLGMAGSFFGGGPQFDMTPGGAWGFNKAKQLYQWWNQLGRGVPGSAPQEQGALAQGLGLMGQQQNAARTSAMAGMGGPGGPGFGNKASFLANMGNAQTGQMGGFDASMMQQFLQSRMNAMSQAGNMASQGAQAGSMGQWQQGLNPGSFAGLGQMLGYSLGGGGGGGATAGAASGAVNTPDWGSMPLGAPYLPHQQAGGQVDYGGGSSAYGDMFGNRYG